MAKILDEFNSDIYCYVCKIKTEHHVQELDKGFYAKCDICNNIEEYSEISDFPLEEPKMVDDLSKGGLKQGEMIELYGYSGKGKSRFYNRF